MRRAGCNRWKCCSQRVCRRGRTMVTNDYAYAFVSQRMANGGTQSAGATGDNGDAVGKGSVGHTHFAKRRTRMSACSLWPAKCSRSHNREQYSPIKTDASSVSTRWYECVLMNFPTHSPPV